MIGKSLTIMFSIFGLSIENLLANKLRTMLTLLGIIVGVAAMISVVTIIKGLNQVVASTFSANGSTGFHRFKRTDSHHQPRADAKGRQAKGCHRGRCSRDREGLHDLPPHRLFGPRRRDRQARRLDRRECVDSRCYPLNL